MGVAVSAWPLAAAVGAAGGLGVVSGTALDVVLARRLQDGDPDGQMRRALAAFPVNGIGERLLTRYFHPCGRKPGEPYTPVPRLRLRPGQAALELSVAAAFAEVWLAKQSHRGKIGINLLEKVQMATPAVLYGAMLAGVDCVLMGAGIPGQIPGLLDRLARHESVELAVHVDGATTGYSTSFHPAAIGDELPPLIRPAFLAVVASHSLATYLTRDPQTRPDGLVVEGPTAGGHNAPPRDRGLRNGFGDPVYGPRDQADLAKVAALGLPFWIAGGFGHPAQLAAALNCGAAGVQVGTIFALSAESGLTGPLREQLLDRIRDATLGVRTDALASPTGFPFKVVELAGTLSDPEAYHWRPRLCDLGYLRVPYQRSPGVVGYRCPAEPVHTYLRKGGDPAESEGRKCLCNALTANVGLGQTRGDGYTELPLVTLGEDLDGPRQLLGSFPEGWTAAQALTWLRGQPDGSERSLGHDALAPSWGPAAR